MIRKINLSSIDDVRAFIQLGLNYDEKIIARKDGFVVDGHSILGVLSLGDLTNIEVEFVGDEQIALEFFDIFENITK